MKGTLDITRMSPSAFSEYVSVCALLLALAHAQSVNTSMLRGYVGNNATVRRQSSTGPTPTPISPSTTSISCGPRPKPARST